jgi:uncharacterized protein YggE
MKRPIVIFLLLVITAVSVNAQTATVKEKLIEVSGSAEMEVLPDEIYLSILLREYMNDKSKVRLDEIDKHFMKVLNELKIDKKDLAIESAAGFYNWDYHKQKGTDFLASKTYLLKLTDLNGYNRLMERLDNKGIHHIYLQRTSHSKIEEYRQKVKIDALKAAKEKAKLMLESIGEQMGEVMFIKETGNDAYYPMQRAMLSNVAMDGSMPQELANEFDVQKIKIRYEVMATFRIK